MKVVAAVGELEQEYEGKVRFNVVSAEDTAELGHEIEEYELGSHGLVAFSATGEVKAGIPGHQFGRKEIVDVIEQVLP